jgi:hypothetical protein
MTNEEIETLKKETLERSTYQVMSQIVDYVKVYGCNTFKNELKEFNHNTYDEIFFPQTKIKECYLTSRK